MMFRARRHRRDVLGRTHVIVVAVALFVSIASIAFTGRVFAQGVNSWGAPYCSSQPLITSIADHKLPRYCGDPDPSDLILYSGDDVDNCNGRSGGCPGNYPTGPGYDGHSGYDYLRDSAANRTQGCTVGHVGGVADSLVFAAESGTVSKSRWTTSNHSSETAGSYGLRVEINHSGDLTSLYGHLAVVMVEEAQQGVSGSVAKGQLIGAVGTTGNSTGAHLHFQAAHGSEGVPSVTSFDPYGWMKSFSATPGPTPPFADPHQATDGTVALRLLSPGQAGPACPAACGGDVFVEDTDTTQVTYPLGAWSTSPNGNNAVNNVGAHWTTMSGNNTTTRSAEYRCLSCSAGDYLVLAAVPWDEDITTTDVARYEVGTSVAIMDQHTEPHRNHPIGVFHFNGTPMVRLTNRGDRYDYTASSSLRVGADSMIFRRLCSGVPPGTPTISSGWGGGG